MLDCTHSLHVCQSGLVAHQPPYRHRQWSPPIAEHMRAHHSEITQALVVLQPIRLHMIILIVLYHIIKVYLTVFSTEIGHLR